MTAIAKLDHDHGPARLPEGDPRNDRVGMTPSWVNRGELCIFCPTPEPEVDTETVTHWGVLLRGGTIRWDPSYGSGDYVPYTEAQARDDARRSGGTVVTRTQTTTLTTTAWVEA